MAGSRIAVSTVTSALLTDLADRRPRYKAFWMNATSSKRFAWELSSVQRLDGVLPLRSLVVCFAFGLGWPVLAQIRGPHIHGAAELNVTVHGHELELQLETPLENVAGFEHAPRTEKQLAAVRTMTAKLRHPETLFAPTAAAACAPVKVRLSSSVLPPALLGEADAAASRSGGAKEHADLDAVFVFRCAHIERLEGLDTSVLQAFPGIRKLKVQVAGPRGQAATVLQKGRTSVRW